VSSEFGAESAAVVRWDGDTIRVIGSADHRRSEDLGCRGRVAEETRRDAPTRGRGVTARLLDIGRAGDCERGGAQRDRSARVGAIRPAPDRDPRRGGAPTGRSPRRARASRTTPARALPGGTGVSANLSAAVAALANAKATGGR
jgi:hypothetical protein